MPHRSNLDRLAWEQTSLLPPTMISFRMTGWLAGPSGRGGWSLEILDGEPGILSSSVSRPIDDLDRIVIEAEREFASMLREERARLGAF